MSFDFGRMIESQASIERRGMVTFVSAIEGLSDRLQTFDYRSVIFSLMPQLGLIPVGYYTGETFKPAKRPPAAAVKHVNGW